MSRDAPSVRTAPIEIGRTGMSGPRKLFVKSYGCQMNVYDSNRMADVLAPKGFIETATPEAADLVILNPCHIREKAAEKVYSELGRIRKLKEAAGRSDRSMLVAVAGCVAQAEGEEILRRAPAVDLVVGPQSYHRLPALLDRVAREGRMVDTEFPVEDTFDFLDLPSRAATRARRDLWLLMPSLHLPVQSGWDRILAAMKRRHTRAHYLGIVERLRAARPDLALTSDFIVGFPGETEEDFRETVTLVDQIGFAGAFSFKYSPRPGTPAAGMADQIPDEIKVERLARLQAAIDRHQADFNARTLGTRFSVLLERPGRHPGQLVGRSPYLQPVQVMAPAALIGEIVAVRITQVGPNRLFGVLDEPAPAARPCQAALAAAGA